MTGVAARHVDGLREAGDGHLNMQGHGLTDSDRHLEISQAKPAISALTS